MRFAYATRSRSLLRSGLSALRTWGPGLAASTALRWATFPLWRPLAARRRGVFRFAGREHPYFLHRHNVTWCNERAVEIPLALAALAEAGPGARILEVGNVLGHYGLGGHDVVDRYETAPGVITEDVVAFRPSAGYDLIVSISTLEHVGFDEAPLDPGKPARAVAHLASLLVPGGTLFATLPAAYNPHLDADLARGAIPFTELRALRRAPRGTAWREVPLADALAAPYGDGGPGATGLVVGLLRAPGDRS